MEKITKIVEKNFVLLETIFAIAFAVSLFLIYYDLKIYSIALSISSLLLALTYFFKGLIKNKESNPLILISFRLQWYSLTLIILGILSQLTFHEEKTLLTAGIVINIISLIFISYIFIKKKLKTNISYYIRSAVYLLLGFIILLNF